MLVDGSDSIHRSDFILVKNFMKKLVGKLTIGPDSVQVGVVQFCTSPQNIRQEFYLNDYNNADDIMKRIDSITQIKQGNSIADGLEFSKQSFLPEHGSRRDKGVRQVLLLFTDGDTEEENAPDVANQLRAMKIHIDVIGVGRIDTDQLYQIQGKGEKPIILKTFEELPNHLEEVVNRVCDEQEDEPDG